MKTSIRRQLTSAALILAMPFALISCGDSPEKATEDLLSVMNRMGDTLATITDKASAEAAKDKLKALGEEMRAIKTRMEKVAKPSSDEEKKLKEKYEKEFTAATKKIMEASMKMAAAGPEAMKVLQDAMGDFKDLAK